MSAKIVLLERFASTIHKPSAFSQRVTPPITCPLCGGTHFIKALAEEFTNTGYGSMEFRSLTAGFQALSVYVLPLRDAHACPGSDGGVPLQRRS